jgi:tetratricopeptide (TPR) repeat protein
VERAIKGVGEEKRQSLVMREFSLRQLRPELVRALLFIGLAFGALCCAGSASALDTSPLFAKALRLKEEHRDLEALMVLEQLLETSPHDASALLHASHLYFRLGWLYSEKEERRRLFFQADEAIRKAAKLKPNDYAIRLMAVVAKGKIASYRSSAEQVRIVWDVREELNTLAAMTHPDDVDLLHVRAWLHFKVGRTSAVERLLARILFGGLPEDLDVDTAMVLMRRAMELRPHSPVYAYDLGIFYLRLGQDEHARPLFEKVLALPAATPEDKVYANWARERLDRLNRAGG